MNGRLWIRLYRQIRRICKRSFIKKHAGRPRIYDNHDCMAVWAFAALMDWPISVTHKRLASGSVGWWLKRHFDWSAKLPSVPTLTRRIKAADFRWLLRQVLRRLRRQLGFSPTAKVVMDATILNTGPYSGDPDSRWTCHGGKWFRGYALHTICDENGLLWAWVVTGANVQEMKVARKLIYKMAAIDSNKVQMVIADSGYDSEPLHRIVRKRLHAMLLAPLNLRGASTDKWRVQQPGRDMADKFLQGHRGRKLLEKRSLVERWYSLFKGSSRVGMLPYHVRRLHRVQNWIALKLMIFYVHQHLSRKDLYTVA
jgi:hypothetical protein